MRPAPPTLTPTLTLQVAVKIVNLSQPLARGGPSNDDDECSTSGVAALLEAALSRALHHPHIVSLSWAALAASRPAYHSVASLHDRRRTPPLCLQVPTHAWGVSEGAVEQGEHLSQVWIVQVRPPAVQGAQALSKLGSRRRHTGVLGC